MSRRSPSCGERYKKRRVKISENIFPILSFETPKNVGVTKLFAQTAGAFENDYRPTEWKKWKKKSQRIVVVHLFRRMCRHGPRRRPGTGRKGRNREPRFWSARRSHTTDVSCRHCVRTGVRVPHTATHAGRDRRNTGARKCRPFSRSSVNLSPAFSRAVPLNTVPRTCVIRHRLQPRLAGGTCRAFSPRLVRRHRRPPTPTTDGKRSEPFSGGGQNGWLSAVIRRVRSFREQLNGAKPAATLFDAETENFRLKTKPLPPETQSKRRENTRFHGTRLDTTNRFRDRKFGTVRCVRDD